MLYPQNSANDQKKIYRTKNRNSEHWPVTREQTVYKFKIPDFGWSVGWPFFYADPRVDLVRMNVDSIGDYKNLVVFSELIAQSDKIITDRSVRNTKRQNDCLHLIIYRLAAAMYK